MTLTLSQLAQRYHEAFEHAEREDGSGYWRRKDRKTTDDALYRLCYDAHDGMLPDDYKYRFIVDALTAIADAEPGREAEAADTIEPDCYTGQLTAWLHSDIRRVFYCNETLETYAPKDGFQLLALAQQAEQREVFASVLRSLQTLLKHRGGEV
jgi:hypothetical protein